MAISRNRLRNISVRVTTAIPSNSSWWLTHMMPMTRNVRA